MATPPAASAPGVRGGCSFFREREKGKKQWRPVFVGFFSPFFLIRGGLGSSQTDPKNTQSGKKVNFGGFSGPGLEIELGLVLSN